MSRIVSAFGNLFLGIGYVIGGILAIPFIVAGLLGMGIEGALCRVFEFALRVK